MLLYSFLSVVPLTGGDGRPSEEREVAPGGEAEQTVRDAHAGQGGLHRRGACA